MTTTRSRRPVRRGLRILVQVAAAWAAGGTFLVAASIAAEWWSRRHDPDARILTDDQIGQAL